MISNSISQTNTGIHKKSTSTVTASSTPSANASNSTAGLEKGQLIRGEVTDLRNHEVSVKLEDGRILSGKLEETGQLSIGDKVVFCVEEVSAKSLTLKIMPNSMDTSQDNTIDKALEAAGLEKTARNKNIVNELLNQKMPIDKKTISLLIRQSLLYKETSIQTLVLLNKYKIPVNEANIKLFETHHNNTHNLLTQLEDLTDSITNSFHNKNSMTDAQFLTQSGQLLNIILNPSDLQTASNPDKTISTPPVIDNNPPIQNTVDLLSQEARTQLLHILENSPLAKSIVSEELLASVKNGTGNINEIAQVLDSLINSFESGFTPPASSGLELDYLTPLRSILSQKTDINQNSTNINTLLSLPQRETLVESLEQFIPSSPLTPSLKEGILSGTISSQEVFKYIAANINASTQTLAKDLLTSEEFKSLLKDKIISNLTLTPENLRDNEEVNRHFEGMLQKLNDLKEYANQPSSIASEKMQGQVTNLLDNFNFVNQLNNFFTYLQLPLKLGDQYTDGKLYVYSKKKSGRTAEDGISVLLHLDMDHLGPLDIYVDLHGNNLSTKFYVEGEDSINLITSHLTQLEEKLSIKGFQINTEILSREKAVNIVEEFMTSDVPTNPVMRYNFDIRA